MPDVGISTGTLCLCLMEEAGDTYQELLALFVHDGLSF